MTRGRKGYYRPYRWLIDALSLVVPKRFRRDWKREWEAEIEHREVLLGKWNRLSFETTLNLYGRSLGAFWDAMWFQRKRLEEDMFQDLKYGIRLLRRNPLFTLVAVVSLALGIGANTAMFTVVDAVMLKKLPVKNPDELILLRWVSGPKPPIESLNGSLDMRGGKSTSTSFSYPVFKHIHDNTDVFSDVFAFAELEQLNVSVDGSAEVASGQIVSGDYYLGLGIQAVHGRIIMPADDLEHEAAPVALISYSYWQRRFGRDPQVLGKTIYLNSSPFTIIGVAPPEFRGTLQVGSSPEITVPMAVQPLVIGGGPLLEDSSNWWVQIIGRLKQGVSEQQALASLDVAFQQSVAEDLKDGEKDPIRLEASTGSRGLNEMRNEFSEPLFILMAVVGLVLAIACLNIANLLLARAASRQKEISVRLALGASRLRLIRQLLTESVLLAVIGGVLGLLFAYWGKDVLVGLLSSRPSELNLNLSIDVRVLMFTAAASIVTGLLFGLAPALRATRIDLAPALKDNARGASKSKSRLSKALLVAQVALSLVLLIGAGLFVRTLRNLGNVELGFNAENLLLFRIDPTLNGYKGERLASFYDQVVERIEAAPGVRAVSISRHPLISGSSAITTVSVPGYASKPGEEILVYVQRVRSNFLSTMEIPLLSGRDLNSRDDENSVKVAVINEAFARTYFPNESPVGRRFAFGKTGKGGEVEIIGMVRDAKFTSVRGKNPLTVYIPYRQNISGLGQMNFEVRTSGNPNQFVPAVRQAVQSVDANVPLFAVKTQSEQVDESLVRERTFAQLSSFFGGLALLLASIGLYGIMSYGVTRRTHEIGIRMALGARPENVLWLVMRETLLLVLVGIAIGLPAALAATQVIESMLFGLTPTDPVTIALATIFMIGVAAFAGYLPARRAARVDPMVALRYE